MTTMPTWQQLRRNIGRIATERGEYAGMPCPVQEAALVLNPKHPQYKALHGFSLSGEQRTEDDGATIVNEWYDEKSRCDVVIWREADGRLCHAMLPRGPMHRMESILKCIGIAGTMDVQAERRAMATLKSLVSEKAMHSYEMTGTFIESSRRSGVTYLFRRLATTLAIRAGNDGTRFLAALCLHPLAYYEGLPMGAMVPTDDVIAHLVLMRTDEHLFWRRSNQHWATCPGAVL